MSDQDIDILDGLDTEAENDDTQDVEPQLEQAKAREEATADEKVVIRCPDSMTSLSHPNGDFPTVTNEGTEMTRAQAKIAKAAAKDAGKRLITVGGQGS